MLTLVFLSSSWWFPLHCLLWKSAIRCKCPYQVSCQLWSSWIIFACTRISLLISSFLQLIFILHVILSLFFSPEGWVPLLLHSKPKFQNISNRRNCMWLWLHFVVIEWQVIIPPPKILPTSLLWFPFQTHFNKCHCCNSSLCGTRQVQCSSDGSDIVADIKLQAHILWLVYWF
jgi:hypothetical protein